MLRGGHAEWPVQGSRWQEHGAAHARGPRAQQAGKLETRALFAGSQGETVARAGGNTCGPVSGRLDLKAPAVPRSDTDPYRTIYLTGIDANGKVAKASARRRYGALEPTGPLRPYGSAHVGPGLAMDTNCS